MKKTVFEIYHTSGEITLRTESDLNALVQGCTLDHPDPRLIRTYSDRAAAFVAFKKLRSDVRIIESFYGGYLILVEEYTLYEQEYEVDEDGEEVPENCFDVLAMTELPAEISWDRGWYKWLNDSWTLVDEHGRTAEAFFEMIKAAYPNENLNIKDVYLEDSRWCVENENRDIFTTDIHGEIVAYLM